MPFINEYISPENYEKYGLAEINKRYVVGGTNARDWSQALQCSLDLNFDRKP